MRRLPCQSLACSLLSLRMLKLRVVLGLNVLALPPGHIDLLDVEFRSQLPLEKLRRADVHGINPLRRSVPRVAVANVLQGQASGRAERQRAHELREAALEVPVTMEERGKWDRFLELAIGTGPGRS